MTPLEINALSGLLQNQGLIINPPARARQGFVNNQGVYSELGTLNTTTVLNNLTRAINLASPSATYYAALTSIGSTTIPALGNSKPSTYTISDTATSYGFIGRIALQALYEYYGLASTPTVGAPATLNLSKLAQLISSVIGWRSQMNQLIVSTRNSTSYLQNTFSNYNDYITADVTNVSIATVLWGQDLINTGRTIELSQISRWGEPVVLLQTLAKYNAITDALSLALSTQFSFNDIENMKSGIATNQQQASLFACYLIITGNDLADILAILNCKVRNINTLADLLSPLKLFPNSANTLTYPIYGVGTTSKNYDFIYVNGSLNNRIPQTYGERLIGMIPDELAKACDAFTRAMLQIKNIATMNIQQFSQVVANLETTKGLPLISAAAQPVAPATATTVLTNVAIGTGSGNTYTFGNVLGAISGIGYVTLYDQIQPLLVRLATNNLATIYQNIYNSVSSSTDPTTYINQANAEITSIRNANTALATQLNTLWNQLGTLLQLERNSLNYAYGNLSELTPDPSANPQSLIGLLDSVSNTLAMDTEAGGGSVFMEAISDTTIMSGQAIVALMRQSRNANRLGIIDAQPLAASSPENGGLNSEEIVPLGVLPANDVPIQDRSNCSGVTLANSQPLPGFLIDSYDSTVPASEFLPSILCNGISSSVYTPNEAIDEVTICNCDCWNM